MRSRALRHPGDLSRVPRDQWQSQHLGCPGQAGTPQGVVIGDVGPRMTPRHPEIRQQQRHGLASHGRAPIRMEEQLAWPDPLHRAGLGDEPLGQRGGLAWRDHPPNHVSAEDIEDHVEVEVGPLHRTQEFCDIP